LIFLASFFVSSIRGSKPNIRKDNFGAIMTPDQEPSLCPGKNICLYQVWVGVPFEISIGADLYRHRIVDQIFFIELLVRFLII